MKKLLAALGLSLLASSALAQSTRTQLNAEINTQLPDNVQGLITPSILRGVLHDMVNSTVTLSDPASTITGSLTINGTLEQSGAFGYIGAFLAPGLFPTVGPNIGLAVSTNFSNSFFEVDLWSRNQGGGAGNKNNKAFNFRKLITASTSEDLVTIYNGGRVEAGQFTAGGIHSNASQFVLDEVAFTTNTPQVYISRTTEAVNATDLSQVVVTNQRTGGSGNRIGLHITSGMTIGTTNEYVTPITALGYIDNGTYTGVVSAWGGILGAQTGTTVTTANAIGLELDTIVKNNISGRKTGLLIADLGASTGAGAYQDAGIVIGKDGAGRGYNYGIEFGAGTGAAANEINLAFFRSASGTIPLGFDFSAVTFSTSTWKGVFSLTNEPAANTSIDGVLLTTLTAATAGNQRYSPRLRLRGNGWKTDATAASQPVDWTIETVPIQGTANPQSVLNFNSQVNNGGYIGRMSLYDSGAATQLQLFNSSVAATFLYVSGTHTGRLYADSTQVIVGAETNIPTRLWTNGTQRVQISGAGGVFVGSTNTDPGVNNFRAAGWVQVGVVAVGSLPTCNAGAEGSRMGVNDSNAASFTAGIGAVVAAGGTTHVPVYCDGTNWRIG